MTVKLHYSRYGCKYIDEFDSIRDAAHRAADAEDYGEMYATKIEDESGTVWERTASPMVDNTPSERLRELAGYPPDSDKGS